ncbi:unnamed protein product [Penicillium olsonii]|uniref:penicillopepsin n=1 Tax=Penicillium olsonii TaxID=99116 RepID=A0A9W4I052_PENOL|nr:unnamed protein product [Penicillium olsonii]CAG7930922.1 unnamed protein product [Penicillium olsonii]CAG8098104.1 unnamed protein product [Penicillium olsonii]CAG8182426.1 unnamed protein product [Penicillium olsonii]
MQSFLFIVMLISLSFNALAIPVASGNRLGRRSFKVEHAKRGDYAVHGPAALRKAYRKFGIDTTTLTGVDVSDFKPFDTKTTTSGKNVKEDAVESDQTGSVTATSVQGDVEFISPVTIGGQTLDMDFDTGSADFWVLNSRLPESERKNRTVFEPSKSKTYKDVKGSTFKIHYGDSSSASGGVGTDTVSIGGVEVENQMIGIPTHVSETFTDDEDSNGLVGLGFSSINTIDPGPQKTFFDNVVSTLDEPVFSVRLLADGVGEYEFGTIDHSKYKGVLANVSVDSSKGFWQFGSAQYSVGGGTFNPIKEVPEAIADTGTSLMLVSPDVAKEYYKQVDGAIYANNAGGYIYPCTAKLPSLAVAVGTAYSATVPGSLVNFSEVGTNTTTGETVCFGGIQSNAGSSLAIYGDVFLKALFVVFDHRGPSLGFAAPV